MEKNKKTNLTLLIVTMLIITISSVVSVILMHGLLMDTQNSESIVNNASTSTGKSNIENDVETETENEIEIDNEAETEAEGEEETTTDANSTENSFATYQENYKNSFKKIINEGNRISIYLGGERKYELPGVVRVYIDSSNNAYFEFDKDSELYSKYGETYKVETDVANIFVYPVGNGGYSEAIFLKLDGTASSVNGVELESNPIVKCEKVQGVENAVNAISYVYSEYTPDGEIGAEGPATVFIDINGNVIK